MNKNLNIEVIKFLLGEAQKISNEYSNRLLNVDIKNIKHLSEYLRSDFNYNSLHIANSSNPLQQILNIITHAMCLDICSKEDSINKFVEMIRNYIDDNVDYSINNRITYLVTGNNGLGVGTVIGGVSGTTLNQYGLNVDTTLNTTLPNDLSGSLGSTGNQAYDEFLDDIKKFFNKNRIKINANTSLSVFTNEYSKFLKVNKKTLPETNGAVIYDQFMNRFFPNSESK